MFSYVKNNPILYVDPSGYVGFFASMAIGIAVEAALTLGFPMLKVIPFLIDILAELITMVIINVLNKLEALYGITPETIITIAITAVAGGLALGFLAKKIGPLLKGKKAIAEAAEEGMEKIAKETVEDVPTKTNIWSKAEVNGRKVYQRDDIIDPNRLDDLGRSNVQRMQDGLAPIGTDGKSVNLHHMTQRNDSALAEMTQTFHKQNHGVIHINGSNIPSGIDRNAFNTIRRNYWKIRALDFL